MDSAQSSSYKCKTYLLKLYSKHSNFWNAFVASENNSLEVIPLKFFYYQTFFET